MPKIKRTAIRVRGMGNAFAAHHPQHPTLFGTGVTRQDAINDCWERLQDHDVYMAIPDWHKPSNDDCPHNKNTSHPCTCRRPQKRKAFKVLRVHDSTVSRTCKKDIVVEVHPNGLLKFREKGRSTRYATTAGEIYERLQAQACAAVAAKRRRK